MKLSSFKSTMLSLQPGETTRINHGLECEAGEDTRQRLYLTRVLADPTVVIGYCHNCAKGGRYTDKGYSGYRASTHSPSPRQVNVFKQDVVGPTTLISDLTLWIAQAQAWAIKNNIKQKDIDRYNIGFDTNTNRIYLPIYDYVLCNIPDGGCDLRGHQLRGVTGLGPKYLTILNKQAQGFTLLHPYSKAPKNKIVIVEDLVSGIHIMRATNNTNKTTHCLVNYGVKINPLTIPIINEFKEAAVWLDNDSEFVIEQALKYVRTIKLYNKAKTRMISKEYNDPKHYIASKIASILDNG